MTSNGTVLARVRRKVNSLLAPFGFAIVRHKFLTSERLIRLRRALITRHRVTLLLDVGAYTGVYARDMRGLGLQGKIISFEPHAEAFSALSKRAANDPAWECHREAVGSRQGDIEFHQAANIQSSSVLPMLDRHVQSSPDSEYVNLVQVPLTTLDIALGELDRKERIWLKIDVQGYEREVLLGATKTLDHVEVIEIELSLVPLYGGQPLMVEMIGYLESLGFSCVSLADVFSDMDTGRLLQVDGIFVRTEDVP